MFELNDSNINEFAHVKVVGVGGGGGNSLNRLIKMGLKDAAFIAINTDAQALLKSTASTKVQIGEKVTRGLGTGSNSIIGEMAAKESREDIIEALGQPDMVFVIAGLGGGTGSGAAPVVASYAKNDIGALTVAIVTVPFSFEGTRRKQRAEESIAKLKEYADAVIVIYNDRTLTEEKKKEYDQKPNFEVVDVLIAQAIQSIVNLIGEPGLINLDFADVKLILKNAGTSAIGVGVGIGEKAAMEAAEEAASFPLFDEKIKDAKSILINITGSEEKLSMFKINEAVEVIQKMTDGNCNILWGATVNNDLGDTVKAIVIASGFDTLKEPDFAMKDVKLSDHEREIYKQIIDEGVKRMHNPATTVAECIELMRELRITLKEMRDGNNDIDEW
ncbi:cell division protein FtsZ [Selenomonas sp. AB3002]|uniref:cell division protein FtsZ n=1 Tax=Selenomonas sp. AB3002 TaxID=1392502 RepID=UPI0009B7F392